MELIIVIIIFLSSIRSTETCYGRYKTESFHLFKGLPKFLFPFVWYFGILSELILSYRIVNLTFPWHTLFQLMRLWRPSHSVKTVTLVQEEMLAHTVQRLLR
jgi:hypothetical protein